MAFAAFSRVSLVVLYTLVFIVNATPLRGAQTGGGRGTGVQRSATAGDRQILVSPRSLFIAGSVVMSDGNPLPTGVVIERVCEGLTKREAYVDVNGNFNFELGVSNVLPDASESGLLSGPGLTGVMGGFPMMQASYIHCELRAQLGGYRSTSIRLDLGRITGQTDVGTIVLHPIAQAPGTTVSVTEMQAPKKARKLLEKAETAFQGEDWKLAQEHLLEAVSVYPRLAPAWVRLGQIFTLTCRYDDARAALSKAVAADGFFVPAYIELARLAAHDQNWQETADLTEHASQLDPLGFPGAFYLNALANLNLGRLDMAENSVQKAQRLDSRNHLPRTHLLLAGILHRKRDHVGEIAQLKEYLRIAPQAADAGNVRYQLRTMELTGHR